MTCQYRTMFRTCRIKEVIALNDPTYFLNVPISIMNSWITTADGKPLPAITVKAIIFFLYIQGQERRGLPSADKSIP